MLGTKTSSIRTSIFPLNVFVIGFPFLEKPSKIPLSTKFQIGNLASPFEVNKPK